MKVTKQSMDLYMVPFTSPRAIERTEPLECYHDWIRERFQHREVHWHNVTSAYISPVRLLNLLCSSHWGPQFPVPFTRQEQSSEIETQDVQFKSNWPGKNLSVNPHRGSTSEIQSTRLLLQSRGSFVQIWGFHRVKSVPEATQCPLAKSNGEEKW